MKRLRGAFVTGMLVLLPFLATVEIIAWFVRTLEDFIRFYLPTGFLPFDFRGLGLITAILLIFVIGAATQNYVGKWAVHMLDMGMTHLPVVGGIYGGIKKFLETIFNPASDRFKGTVLVEFPRDGVYSIGFRTGKPDSKLAKKGGANLANIFVPCTPNPTSGFYLLVPEEQLIALDMSVQEAFKVVVSMGLVTSEEAAT